jgi:hypothetical protein
LLFSFLRKVEFMTIRMRLSDARIPVFVLRENIFRQRRYTTTALHNAAHGLNMSTEVVTATHDQYYLLITSFALSCASVVMAFFPLCGLLAAISSLFLGLYARDKMMLPKLSTWTVLIACLGLLCAVLCSAFVLMDYINNYF